MSDPIFGSKKCVTKEKCVTEGVSTVLYTTVLLYKNLRVYFKMPKPNTGKKTTSTQATAVVCVNIQNMN